MFLLSVTVFNRFTPSMIHLRAYPRSLSAYLLPLKLLLERPARRRVPRRSPAQAPRLLRLPLQPPFHSLLLP
eukprot:3252744-Pleurochrysis_carterae.AAC.1